MPIEKRRRNQECFPMKLNEVELLLRRRQFSSDTPQAESNRSVSLGCHSRSRL